MQYQQPQQTPPLQTEQFVPSPFYNSRQTAPTFTDRQTLDNALMQMERHFEAEVINNVLSETDQQHLFETLRAQPFTGHIFSTYESDAGIPDSLTEEQINRLQTGLSKGGEMCTICCETLNLGCPVRDYHLLLKKGSFTKK